MSLSLSRTAALAMFAAMSLGIAGCSGETATGAADESEVRAGKSTLTIQLVGRELDQATHEWKKVPLESMNQALASAGLGTFDKSITVGAADGAKFDEVEAKLAAANAKLGRDIEFRTTWDPNDYVGLCYKGPISALGKTIEALVGSAFPEYLGIPAQRFGTKKTVFDADGNEEEWLSWHLEENPGEVDAWKNFDTSSDKFLLMSNGGPQGDGTELFAVLIPKCQ